VVDLRTLVRDVALPVDRANAQGFVRLGKIACRVRVVGVDLLRR
jgi:hypothetical protein